MDFIILPISFVIIWHIHQRWFSFCCTFALAQDFGKFDFPVSSLILIAMGNCARNRGNPRL